MTEIDDYRVEENSFDLAKRLNKPFLVSQMLPAYTKETQKLLNVFYRGRDEAFNDKLTPVRPIQVVKTRTFNKATKSKNMHGPKESRNHRSNQSLDRSTLSTQANSGPFFFKNKAVKVQQNVTDDNDDVNSEPLDPHDISQSNLSESFLQHDTTRVPMNLLQRNLPNFIAVQL